MAKAKKTANGNSSKGATLIVRQARLSDVPAMAALSRRIYAPSP